MPQAQVQWVLTLVDLLLGEFSCKRCSDPTFRLNL
jgi:hypothetical protein